MTRTVISCWRLQVGVAEGDHIATGGVMDQPEVAHAVAVTIVQPIHGRVIELTRVEVQGYIGPLVPPRFTDAWYPSSRPVSLIHAVMA